MTLAEPPLAPARRLPAYHGDAGGMLAGAEAMLQGVAASGRAAARWYTVAPGALLLGASQNGAAVDAAACQAAGVNVYKRAAGGTVVLADDGLLGFDVALPRDHPLLLADITQSYRWLGEAWTQALRTLGVPAELVSVDVARAAARATDGDARLARAACFGALSPFEVTLQGRKAVGLAQVRRRYGALLQSAVLLHWAPERLSALLAVPPIERTRLAAALGARAVGLDDVAGQPVAREALVSAVEGAVQAQGLSLADDAWIATELDLADHLGAEHYHPLNLGHDVAS